jgi:threonine synthase
MSSALPNTSGLPSLADELGIASLRAKYEGANPTGSHKDRMSALFIERAKEAGFRTVAIASSGNAGDGEMLDF